MTRAPAEHGGQDEVAAPGIVGAVDERAAGPGLGGHLAVDGAVVGGDHDEEEARHVAPAYARGHHVNRPSVASLMQLGRERGAHHGDAGAGVDEPRHLPLGDRPAADDETRRAR